MQNGFSLLLEIVEFDYFLVESFPKLPA